MDRYPEPEDRNEAYAETSQEELGVRDEDWLTAATDENNRRADDLTEDEEDGVMPPKEREAGTGRPAEDE